MSLHRGSNLLFMLPAALALGVLPLSPARSLAGDAPDRAEEEFFESKVRPLLVDQCLDCHGREKSKGGLRLDSRGAMLKGAESGPVVIPGKPESSPLITAIRYEGDIQMPPKGKLKDHEIAVLTEWVKRGAVWPIERPDTAKGAVASAALSPPPVPPSSTFKLTQANRSFWSFQPVQSPRAPAVNDRAWPRSDIDRFILKKLEENNLAPAPAAEKAVLIRRAYFDLIGLPPSPADVAAFAADRAPAAFEKVVDALLASPQYGERWGRHWLDVARYGEDQAHSFQPRLYPYGYRYRDWVVRALNRDLPYDRFVLEQVAGDLLDGPDRAQRLAALGFLSCGPVYYGDSERHDQYADRIDTLCRGFLGLTVACARCHDHKYDPIPTTDYYALEGVFASTEYIEVPAVPQQQVDAYKAAAAAIAAKEKEITAFLKAEAERLKLKVQNNQFKPVERMLSDDAKKKLAAERARLETLKKNAPPKFPVIHTLGEASQAKDAPILIRGNPATPGAKVPRRFLTVLEGEQTKFTCGSGRLELARAIASPANPLTARVMANRVWSHHFGKGLVATLSNFGELGDRPSHPELLDWLAYRLIASGWSLKALHREIMLSAAYRQSSRFDATSHTKDPENVLLWRMNRRRLDVEAWRDAMLAVSGQLDLKLGGPPTSLDAPNNHRRTLYAAISRHDLAPLLRLFDFPDPNITSAGRVETTVPLQQLFVLNSEFMATSARAVSLRIGQRDNSGAGVDHEATILRAYQRLFGRVPTPRERKLGLEYLSQSDGALSPRSDMSRSERYAQALLATNEFIFVD